MKKTWSTLTYIGKWIIAMVLAAMVLMTFINAFLRYTFHTNITEFEELARYLFVWTAFLGAIIAYVEGKHVGVDMLVNALHGLPKLIVQLISEACVLFACLLITYGGVLYFNLTWYNPAPATNLPFGVVSASGVVAGVALIAITVRDIIKIIKNHKNEQSSKEVKA